MWTLIIPAKRKSKRLPNKNWEIHKELGGISLVYHKLQQALRLDVGARIVLSVDFDYALKDERVVVRRRPWHVRTSMDVVIDALDYVGSYGMTDAYALLQPTSPLVEDWQLLEMIALVSTTCGNVVAVNPAFKPCGAFYGGMVRDVRRTHSFYKPSVRPHVLDWKASIDIDYDYDLAIAMGLAANDKVKG